MATSEPPPPPPPEPPLSPPPPPYPNWLDLPREITSKILLKLSAEEILLNAQSVCSQWRSICKDPSMWRTIDMHDIESVCELHFSPDKICREAVDRSSGDLSSISLGYFATDDVLNYITDRCKNIKHLWLVQCLDVSDDGLRETAAKLPLLEELELSYCEFSGQTIRSVGLSCPLLKSFKLNSRGVRHPHIEIDVEALAIAESMPQLRYLQLFGNKLTNDGLKAILSGCPNLECLDLRKCFNVNLGSTLGKACAERIKNIRHPYDRIDDYEFDGAFNDNYFSDDEFMIPDYDWGFEEGFSLEFDAAFNSNYFDEFMIPDYDYGFAEGFPLEFDAAFNNNYFSDDESMIPNYDFGFEEGFPLGYSGLGLASGDEEDDDDASYDGSDGSFDGDNLDFE